MNSKIRWSMKHRTENAIWGIFGLLAMIAVLLAIVHCGSSWKVDTAKAISAGHVAADGVWTIARKRYKSKCGAIAKQCKVDPCIELEACQLGRRKAAAACKAVHTALGALGRIVVDLPEE